MGLLSLFGTEVVKWSEALVHAIPGLTIGFGLMAVFVLVAQLFHRLILRIGARLRRDPDVVLLFGESVRIVLIIAGLVVGLNTAGVHVSAIVASLGLTGFALGFALKDSIANLLAGVMILIYKPFTRGDRILVSNFEGDVVEINLRYTVLNMAENKVLIPNSTLLTTAIVVKNSDPRVANS